MRAEEIREVAWVGDSYVRGPVRGIILAFHGLGGGTKTEPTMQELTWARAGGLVVFPYYGPWSWMNRQARAFVDDLVDSIRRESKLPDSVPLISTGGSMGGHGSLIFTRYTKHKVARCLAMYPVCDLAYHRTERPDLPPTVAFAFRSYSEDMATLLKEHSPIDQAAKMPRIPYLIIHGNQDKSVNKEKHSDRMAAAMKTHGHELEYVEVDGMGHGGPMWIEIFQKQLDFVMKGLAS